MHSNPEEYKLAQRAIADLKSSVLATVCQHPGISNARVGRLLGIQMGHARHEGHISRTMLALLEGENLIEQHADKLWYPTDHGKA